MPARLPPLNALRAFEAAARHLSFRKAAEELHVTPAAISHQIKALEENLGVKLFRRVARGLELTGVAEACLLRLREGFDSLAEAVELIRSRTRVRTITVGAAPSFAGKWLVPRIQRFVTAFPDIDVRIAAGMNFVDGRQDASRPEFNDADIAIRFGTGRYPGYRADKLFSGPPPPRGPPRPPGGPPFSPARGPPPPPPAGPEGVLLGGGGGAIWGVGGGGPVDGVGRRGRSSTTRLSGWTPRSTAWVWC